MIAPAAGEQRAVRDEADGGGVGAAIDELLDPSGERLGLVLPLILAGTLIAGLAFALHRRLRESGAAP